MTHTQTTLSVLAARHDDDEVSESISLYKPASV